MRAQDCQVALVNGFVVLVIFFALCLPQVMRAQSTDALELRHQYAIGYRPRNFDANGKWHHLKIKINPPRGLPHLFVRSRDGYYALTNAH